MTFASYITNLRTTKHLSKRELASKMDVSPATIVRIESGLTLKPSKSFLTKLSNYLNVDSTKILKEITLSKNGSMDTNSILIYGTYLFMDGWFIQNLYRYNKDISFGIKAVKKREPNNIILGDSFVKINTNNNIDETISKALYKYLQVTSFKPKGYIIAFDDNEKDYYEKFKKIKLNINFQITLVLLNTDLTLKEKYEL
ncbi:MAG: helix-turn-helix transcriptional regulator [Thomasclavelia sp.]|nr:helix-turn-helix transcriptional regulator [Thomasclavelia sp.]